MIKTIIFDNNGVLTSSETQETFLNMANFLGVPKIQLRPIWKEAGRSLDTGHKTTEQFYQEIMDYFNKKFSLKDMQKAHMGCYLPNKKSQDFVKKLKSRYKVVLLSNFGDKFDDFLGFWKLDEIFDSEDIFVSHKLKLRKPDKRIYEYVLKKINNRPEETIFVDDSLENVEAAEDVGINGIVFKTLDQFKQDFQKYITI